MTLDLFSKKTVAELDATDLALLADIPEGWFVEYKRDPIPPKVYAKEASAFANAHGGWLFIGLDEDPKTRKPAGGPGVPTKDATKIADQARDGIAQNLSPAPWFEMHVVHGPIPPLAIDSEHSVIVIRVPESRNTPHIHCSGKVYRRVADSSAPAGINDRADLDQLYARREQQREMINEILDLGFDENWLREFATAWIHIAVVPDPSRSGDPCLLPFEKFKEIVASPQGPHSISMPDIFASAFGFIARNQRHQDLPHGAAVTLEATLSGAFSVTIPLSTAAVTSLSDIPQFLESEKGRLFVELLLHKGFRGVRAIDGTFLASTMYALGGLICRIIEEQAFQARYLWRLRVMNAFRCVPFFDSDDYLASCTRDAVPVIHRTEFQAPLIKKRWLEMEGLPKENAFAAPLALIIPGLGVAEDISFKVIEQAAHASAHPRQSDGKASR